MSCAPVGVRRTSRSEVRSSAYSARTRTIVAPSPSAASSADCSEAWSSAASPADRPAVTEGDSSVVQDRDVRRLQLGNAGRYECPNAVDRFSRKARAAAQSQADACAGIARGLVGKLRRFRRRDDDASVVNPVDSTQSRLDIAG